MLENMRFCLWARRNLALRDSFIASSRFPRKTKKAITETEDGSSELNPIRISNVKLVSNVRFLNCLTALNSLGLAAMNETDSKLNATDGKLMSTANMKAMGGVNVKRMNSAKSMLNAKKAVVIGR